MNPPYGSQISKWIQKAYEESLNGATVVCLIPARPDSRYWQDVILPYAAKIQFIRGRLHFSDSKLGAGFPSAIVLFHKFNQGQYKQMTYWKERG